MLFRLLIEKEALPPLNGKKMKAYCQNMVEVLDDEGRSKTELLKAATIVGDAWEGSGRPRTAPTHESAYYHLIEACGAKWPIRNADIERQRGRVKRFSDGFIDQKLVKNFSFTIRLLRVRGSACSKLMNA